MSKVYYRLLSHRKENLSLLLLYSVRKKLGVSTKTLAKNVMPVSVLDFVKSKIIAQRTISQSKGQMSKFYSVWKPFLCLL